MAAVSDVIRTAIKLMVIGVSVTFYQFVTLQMMITMQQTITSGIEVKQLWQEGETNDTQPCLLIDSSQEVFTLHGSRDQTCTLQVTAGNERHLRIDVPPSVDSDSDDYFVYVEKIGHVLQCPYRYVAINPEQGACYKKFMHENLIVNIQGDGNLVIREEQESTFECPAFDQNSAEDPEARHSSVCSNLKGYNNQSTCNVEWGGFLNTTGLCRFDFQSNCNATISKGEVKLQCIDSDFVTKTQKFLLLLPDEVTELDLSSNRIISIYSKSFSHLYILQGLYLNNNTLGSLQTGLFDNLHNLKFLLLNGSRLDSLTADLFRDLSSLTHLYLSDNMLSALPSTLVHDLLNLEVLLLERNLLVNLNGNFLLGLTNLQELDLSNNNLSALAIESFKGLENLHTLRLSNNQLSAVETTLLEDLKNLSILNLHNNLLSNIPADLFQEHTNLTVLTLHGNEISRLDVDTFQGLDKMTNLSLGNNTFNELPVGLFEDLESLLALNLSYNQFVTFESETLRALTNLSTLNLQFNLLNKLPIDIFHGLENLTELRLNNNQFSTLGSDIFKGLNRLVTLRLNNNSLVELPIGLFKGLERLEILTLYHNEITSLKNGVFQDLKNLTELSLNYNQLSSLPVGVFQELQSLESLNIRSNQIHTLEENIFEGLESLTILRLTNNSLTELPAGLFRSLTNMVSLTIRGNQITSLDVDIFKNLTKLQRLFMHHNNFRDLPLGIFDNNTQLKLLRLNENRFHKFDGDLFRNLKNLTFFDITANRFKDIPKTQVLFYLKTFGVAQNPLTDVDRNSFSNLTNKTRLLVSQHEVCQCYASRDLECIAEDNMSPYLTCKRLLSDRVLVGFIWIIGLNALIGNLFVLIWKQKHSETNSVQSILLSNLAVADFLMGIYMVIIASADVYFGDHFPMQSEKWRSGTVCRIAGTLAILSSEASVFFLTSISVDRLISIRYRDTMSKNRTRSTWTISLVIWVISLALGLIPSLLAGRNFKFYDTSHVCIGLPLSLLEVFSKHHFEPVVWESTSFWLASSYSKSHGFTNGLYYSTALFLGLNFACFLLILVSYIEIVRTVKISFKQAGGTYMKDEIRLTLKVTAIVATDFCCWFPIIILGILVQTREITLPPDAYAWLVTCVLPINSAINPYLYTISEVIYKHRKQKQEDSGQENEVSVVQQMVGI